MTGEVTVERRVVTLVVESGGTDGVERDETTLRLRARQPDVAEVRRWRVRASFRVKDLPQLSQINGFSDVWIFWCRRKSCDRPNAWPHVPHT